MIILLISKAALEGIQKADTRGDNVLIEYEAALELAAEGGATVLPILLGDMVMDQVTESKLYQKFTSYDVSVYPDAPHAHRFSGKNVRATMKALFALQGIHTSPENLEAVVEPAIKALVKQTQTNDALRVLRDGQKKKEEIAAARTEREAAMADRQKALNQARAQVAVLQQSDEGLTDTFYELLKKEKFDEATAMLNQHSSKINPNLHGGSWNNLPLANAVGARHKALFDALLKNNADPSIFRTADGSFKEQPLDYARIVGATTFADALQAITVR